LPENYAMTNHTLYRLQVQPRTAFATPLRGDTLFGQCCWHLRHLLGEGSLTEVLAGYCSGSPFLVLSDALPSGHLPRPTLPLNLLGCDLSRPEDRKNLKGCRWLPVDAVVEPLHQWHRYLRNDGQAAESLGLADEQALWLDEVRTHNCLNRLTNTTGTGEGFAPYERHLTWYHHQLTLDIYAVFDSRLGAALLTDVLAQIGLGGYGKEASSGLGKFDLLSCEPWQFPAAPHANSWLTLAPAAPQGMPWQADQCFYDIYVRFGRHGSAPQVANGNPWKNPVLMADCAALLTPATFDGSRLFSGQGLGGVSLAIPDTVHQGYAPIVPVAHDLAATLENRQS